MNTQASDPICSNCRYWTLRSGEPLRWRNRECANMRAKVVFTSDGSFVGTDHNEAVVTSEADSCGHFEAKASTS